ncbi:hypothetical protein GX51_06229 [Blastomyces parvus]|uniref:Uncharacterized protein n=1 Tax=Blastomyces parvus TaxID=2060905 RepID=A0A2B7WSZ7_9EURO|nr:hypothetical protein GX51_06229 [Blastomyces parvus]
MTKMGGEEWELDRMEMVVDVVRGRRKRKRRKRMGRRNRRRGKGRQGDRIPQSGNARPGVCLPQPQFSHRPILLVQFRTVLYAVLVSIVVEFAPVGWLPRLLGRCSAGNTGYLVSTQPGDLTGWEFVTTMDSKSWRPDPGLACRRS